MAVPLRDLCASDVAVRRAAANLGAREAYREHHVNTAARARVTAAVHALLEATRAPAVKVSTEAAVALAELVRRYPVDRARVRTRLVDLLAHPSSEARCAAIAGAGVAAGWEVVPALLPLRHDG